MGNEGRDGRRLAAAACLVAVLAGAAPAARADEAAESDFHYRLATRAYRRGDFETAVREFFLVQRIAPSPGVQYNLALSFDRLEDEDAAFLAYSEYLSMLPEGDDGGGLRAQAEAALERLAPEVARVRVRSDPPGATIFVDRRALGAFGRAPRVIAVEPGERTILLEADGYRPAERTVVAADGSEVTVDATLERIVGSLRVDTEPSGRVQVRSTGGDVVAEGTSPLSTRLPPGTYTVEGVASGRAVTRDVVQVREEAATTRRLQLEPLPAPTGRLTVTSNVVGAVVRLDGDPVGFAPLVLPEVPAGQRRLRVEEEGMQPWESTLVVEPEVASWATVSLEDEDARRHSVATWVLGAGGLAALVAGGVVGGLALANHADFEDARDANDVTRVNDLRERGVALSTTADVLFVTGGIALAAAVVLFVLEELDPPGASRGTISTGDPL